MRNWSIWYDDGPPGGRWYAQDMTDDFEAKTEKGILSKISRVERGLPLRRPDESRATVGVDWTWHGKGDWLFDEMKKK